MGLFGAHKVGGETIEEVGSMIKRYFKGRGLDPAAHEIAESEGCGWWVTEGSAKVYIFVQDSPTGPVLRITSPIVYVPEQNKEAFYRRLLDINSGLTSCRLATYENYVLVLAQRQTLGMVQEEVESHVWNVAYVADTLDNKLAAEFHTQLYRD